MATSLFYLFSLQVILWITTITGLKIIQPQLEPISDSNWGSKGYSKRDEYPFSSLDLKGQEHFLWGSPSVYGSPFANMTMFTSDNELIISMERFSHMLKSVNCGETIKLTFKSNETFQYAIHAWNWTNKEEKNRFIMIANYAGCGEERIRQPYYVYHVDFDISNFTARLFANKTTWKEAAHTFHLDFGQIGSSNSPYYDNSTMSQPLNNLTSQPSIFSRKSSEKKLAGLNLTQDWNKALFETKISGVKVGLSCADCGITGEIEIISHIEYSFHKISVFTIRAQPTNVEMHMVLKLTAEGTLHRNWAWHKHLITLPLIGGFRIPHILSFGPRLIIGAGFEASSLNGTAIITGGAKAVISDDSIARINVKALTKGQLANVVDFHGWSPSIKPVPLHVNAEVEAKAEAYLQFSVGISIELFHIGADIAVQLQAPRLQIAARLMYNAQGVCANKKKQFGVDIHGNIGFFVDIRGWDRTSKSTTNNLFEVSLWGNRDAYKFTPLCFGFGPNAIESSALPACPFYTETVTTPSSDATTSSGKMRRAPPITTTMASQAYLIHEHIMEKRGKNHPPIMSFFTPGGLTCYLKPTDFVKYPPYPQPTAITNIELKPPEKRKIEEDALLATVERWYIGRQDDQVLPSITKVDTGDLPTAGSNNQQVFVGVDKSPRLSTDHLWEQHFLPFFISSQLDASSFDCHDFEAVFLVKNSVGYTDLSNLFFLLPSTNRFPAFIGVLDVLNMAKGAIFDMRGYRISIVEKEPVNKVLFDIQNSALVFVLCRDPLVADLFRRTNARIYRQFSAIDDKLNTECITRQDGSPIQPTWASRFSSYMDYRISLAETNAYTFVTSCATIISNRLAHPTGTPTCDAQDIIEALNRFMESYLYTRDNFNFDNFQLEYPGIQIGRRSGCEQSCPGPPALAGRGAASDSSNMCRSSTSTSFSTSTTSSATTTTTTTTTTTHCPCPSTLCGNKCVNLYLDNNNCGSCGNSCGTNPPCICGICNPRGIEVCQQQCMSEFPTHGPFAPKF